MIRPLKTSAPRLARDAHIAQWLEQARAGSQTALGQLLCAHQNHLRRVAVNALSVNLQAKLDPSDLVQDSLLEAFRTFAQFKGESPQQLGAWLRRILLYNAADVARRYQQTDKRRSSLEISLDSAHGTLSVDVRLLPPEQAGEAELQAILDRTLAELPAHLRNVVLLRQRQYLSFAAIGQQTGRSPEAARKLWTRAIARLRANLQSSS